MKYRKRWPNLLMEIIERLQLLFTVVVFFQCSGKYSSLRCRFQYTALLSLTLWLFSLRELLLSFWCVFCINKCVLCTIVVLHDALLKKCCSEICSYHGPAHIIELDSGRWVGSCNRDWSLKENIYLKGHFVTSYSGLRRICEDLGCGRNPI